MRSTKGFRHYLKSGGVIAYPTESVFGLGCDPNNRNAVLKVLQLKGRPQHKGLILVADRFSRFLPFISGLETHQIEIMNQSWLRKDKPHTWVVPCSKNCPKWLTGKHASIAIRVTKHPLTARICKDTGMALVSTSANRSGLKPAKNSKQAREIFGSEIRVISGTTGGLKNPSTIQDLITGKILRK